MSAALCIAEQICIDPFEITIKIHLRTKLSEMVRNLIRLAGIPYYTQWHFSAVIETLFARDNYLPSQHLLLHLR